MSVRRISPARLGPVFVQHVNPILVIDPADGQLVAANAAAARFYGWSVEELCERRISQINTLSPMEIQREMALARAEQRSAFAFRHRTASGAIVDVEVVSSPLEVDGRQLLLSVIHDGSHRHRSLWAMQESEAFAHAIVDSAPVGIAVAGLDGRLLRVNEAMTRITGYPEAELLGMDYRELTHPDDRGVSAAGATAMHAGERSYYRLAKRYLRRDGSVAEVETYSTVIHDGDGQPRFQVGVVHDLTSQRQAARAAERAAEQLHRTMESVTDAIFIVDHDWVLTYVNPRFEEVLGIAREEVLGTCLWDSFAAARGGGFERTYRAAVDSGVPATVVEHYAPTDRWYEARAYPGEGGLVVYFSDVTERIDRERQLERVLDSERRNAARLQELDEVKNAFLTAVSHELRTPLTVVHGLAETLPRLRGHLDPSRRERIEDALIQHSTELVHLLDELLDVDRLARGTLAADRQAVDVAALVTEVVADSEVADRCQLEVPEQLLARVDKIQVAHLLTNLLNNVGKYAPEGCVEVTVDVPTTGRVRLQVRDEGPGIPRASRRRVFEPFVRLDRDHPQPGTGVGLALVAEFARLHGGRAYVAEVDRGTRVVVELSDLADD